MPFLSTIRGRGGRAFFAVTGFSPACERGTAFSGPCEGAGGGVAGAAGCPQADRSQHASKPMLNSQILNADLFTCVSLPPASHAVGRRLAGFPITPAACNR